MKMYDRKSVQLNRGKLDKECQRDAQVTDMFPRSMLMEGNSHGSRTYFEWCRKDAKRIGNTAYLVYEVIGGDEHCCIMRKNAEDDA
jgi:hypothetical protein